MGPSMRLLVNRPGPGRAQLRSGDVCSGRDASRSRISTDCHVRYEQSSGGLDSVPIIQPVHHINLGRKMTN